MSNDQILTTKVCPSSEGEGPLKAPRELKTTGKPFDTNELFGYWLQLAACCWRPLSRFARLPPAFMSLEA